MNPDVTADQLLLSVAWSAWIWGATMLEERDLVAEFGESYRAYQRQVPMLVPWRGRVTLATAAGERDGASPEIDEGMAGPVSSGAAPTAH